MPCGYFAPYSQQTIEAGVLRMKDDDGDWVKAGDFISFSYGIPFVFVRSEVVERYGKLVAVDRDNSEGHELLENPLRTLRKRVGNWHKSTSPETS